MSSLRSIMNPDEDVVDPRNNKKDATAAPPDLRPPQHSRDSTATRGSSFASTSTASSRQLPRPVHSTTSSTDRSSLPPSSSLPSSRAARPEARSPSSSSTLLPSGPTSSGAGPDQRSSHTPDAMDHSYHGRAGSSKATPPMRPFPTGGDAPQQPLKLTPVTGRVSKALKGMPVHTCNICVPPKTFTRNEHLRRHQLSHQKPSYVCPFPGCDREFHRKDLLERHQQRHEQEGHGGGSRRPSDSASGTGGESSRGPISTGPSSTQPGSGSVASSEGTSATSTTRPPFQTMSNSPRSSASTMTPRRSSTADSYGQSHNYYTTSPRSMRPIPLIQPMPMTPIQQASHRTLANFSGPPNPPLIQTQFTPSDTPDLLPSHDALPSSASSTYSPSSEWSRPHHRLFPPGPVRSGSDDWANAYPSPFAATSRDGVGMDLVPATSAGYDLYNAYTAAPLVASLAGSVFPFSPDDSSMPGPFSDGSGGLDQLHQHGISSSIVRSPSPPPPTPLGGGAHSSETLVSQAAPLHAHATHERLMNSISCMVRQKEGALLSASAMIPGAIPLSRTIRHAVPLYLEVYWERFHSLYPILHRATFDATADENDILVCAMAAVATQFFPDKEARINGIKLHEHALEGARLITSWTLPIMQAFFLCEFFSRFRGRKTSIRPSAEFDSLYKRVLEHVLEHAAIAPSILAGDHTSPETRWREWVDLESRRRLLAACFVVDVHTGVYQEQPCVQSMGLLETETLASGLPIPLSDPTAALWEMQDAEAWVRSFGTSESPFGRLLSNLSPGELTKENVDCFSPFDRAVVLAAEALQLPRRPDPEIMDRASMAHPTADPAVERILALFPDSPLANAYVALHYTPLHDLLAVSGDTWVFGLKVKYQSSFKEQQERLRRWANSPAAAAATVHASRALTAFLEGGDRMTDGSGKERTWRDDISDYWGMYVCALICWAYGHPVGRRSGLAASENNEEDAMAWLRAMATGAAAGSDAEARERRRGAGRVVVLVRARLEEDCIGSKNRLYVDAITILKKLIEGANWPWF